MLSYSNQSITNSLTIHRVSCTHCAGKVHNRRRCFPTLRPPRGNCLVWNRAEGQLRWRNEEQKDRRERSKKRGRRTFAIPIPPSTSSPLYLSLYPALSLALSIHTRSSVHRVCREHERFSRDWRCRGYGILDEGRKFADFASRSTTRKITGSLLGALASSQLRKIQEFDDHVSGRGCACMFDIGTPSILERLETISRMRENGYHIR